MTSAQNWREKRQHGESSRTWKLGRENIRTKEQVIRERSTARRELVFFVYLYICIFFVIIFNTYCSS